MAMEPAARPECEPILPSASAAARLPGGIDNLTVVTIEAGPQGIAWSHPDAVSSALLDLPGA